MSSVSAGYIIPLLASISATGWVENYKHINMGGVDQAYLQHLLNLSHKPRRGSGKVLVWLSLLRSRLLVPKARNVILIQIHAMHLSEVESLDFAGVFWLIFVGRVCCLTFNLGLREDL